MLNTETKTLMQEIRTAKDWLKPYLTKRAELIRVFAGPHWKEGAPCPASPENYPFSFVSFVGPQLLFGPPTVEVEPTTVELHDTAEALELAVNAWLKETSQKQVMEEVLDDTFYGFGFTKTGVCPYGHHMGAGLQFVEGDAEMVPNYPFRVRVDPRTVLLDPQAKNVRQCRFLGHSYEMDLEDVLKDSRNDPAGLAQLNEQMAQQEQDRQDTAAFPSPERHHDPDRKRITLYELYLPEHGRVMTIAERGDNDGIVLRDEDFFGPDEGPYTLWGLGTVAGEMMPISPIQATWDQFKEVEAHAKQAARDAGTHKVLGVYGLNAENDAKNIKKADSGEMVAVADPNAVKALEVGGVSESRMAFLAHLRERLERQMGFGEAQQGIAGKKTATGEQIASKNSDLRVDKMRDRIADAMAADARKVGWHFFNDQSIGRLEVTATDPISGEQIPATFVAGRWDGGYVANQYVPPEPDSDHSDYNYNIDTQTMVKADDALEQKRAQDELTLSVTLAPAILQFPHMNWRRIIDRYGKKNGTKNLSKIILNDQFMPVAFPDPLATGQGQQQLGPQPGAKPPQGQGMGPKPGGNGAARPASPSFGGAGAGMATTAGLLADARGGAGSPFG